MKLKKVGAVGATIFYARGTGEKEFQKFFNLHVESSKEIILILTPEDKNSPSWTAWLKRASWMIPARASSLPFRWGGVIGLTPPGKH